MRSRTNRASRGIGLLASVLITAVSAPAHATKGPDDYGLWVISGLIALVVLAGLSAAIYFPLRFWARRGGRKEGSYWLTLLGSIAGLAVVIVVVRLAPLDAQDIFRSSVPYAFQLGLPLLGGIAGFFAWRRKR